MARRAPWSVASGLLAAGALAGALVPGIAHASCAAPRPVSVSIREAPAVFVGTVTSLENGRRWATVAVDDVWKGDHVPDEVEVRAGPKDPPGPVSVASSVDRYFRVDLTYLFVPYRRHGSIFRDNSCTRTTLYRDALQRFHPDGDRPTPRAGTGEPEATRPASEPDPSGAVVLILAGAGVALLILFAWWVRRAKR